MATLQRQGQLLQQQWWKTRFISRASCSRSSFCTMTKAERVQRLADKYKPNTKMPSKIGQFAHIDAQQLVYTPKYADGLRPEFYASHLVESKGTPQSTKSSKSDSPSPSTSELCSVPIFEYKKRHRLKGRGNTSDSLQFLLFSAVSLGAPALLLGTMYRWPEWSNKMTGYMTSEAFFYWTQAGLMAFLLTAFGVGLKRQIGRWTQMMRRKVYGSNALVTKISLDLMETKMLNIEYVHNTLFQRLRLSKHFDLHDLENGTQCGYFYLKPSVNEMTQTADVEVAVDLPDGKGNLMAVTIPRDGTVLNWESFVLFMKEVPNAAGKFKPVGVDADGYIPVATYSELMAAPRTSLNIYAHGIPPYRKKNGYLFVPNQKRTKLHVVYDCCKSRNQSLVNNGVFYEENGETFLHCGQCHNAKNKKSLKALTSSVDWKLDDAAKGDDATVMVKVDASILKNPLEFTDAFGHCPLETFIRFYCTNTFRLSHPVKPEKIEDVFVCGEMEQYDDWKQENSPALKAANA